MSFFGALLGTDAAKTANEAAADTFRKQYENAQQYETYGDTLPGRYKEVSRAYDPYTQAGKSALQQLLAGLGLGGDQDAFTKAYQGLPGYQSGLATGQQAAERGINAGGGLNSGAALKALYRYGSDYENQRAGDYLSRLAGVTGQGLTATGGQTGLEARGIQGQENVRSSLYQGRNQSAPTIGQGMVAGAQAEQEGAGNIAKLAASLAGTALGGMGGFGALGGLMGGAGATQLSKGWFPSNAWYNN